MCFSLHSDGHDDGRTSTWPVRRVWNTGSRFLSRLCVFQCMGLQHDCQCGRSGVEAGSNRSGYRIEVGQGTQCAFRISLRRGSHGPAYAVVAPIHEATGDTGIRSKRRPWNLDGYQNATLVRPDAGRRERLVVGCVTNSSSHGVLIGVQHLRRDWNRRTHAASADTGSCLAQTVRNRPDDHSRNRCLVNTLTVMQSQVLAAADPLPSSRDDTRETHLENCRGQGLQLRLLDQASTPKSHQ